MPTILAVGASTGGPKVVLGILKALPPDFEGAVLVVQHIAEGCAAGYAQWLGQESRLPVALAHEGAAPRPGQVLVAPNGAHMTLTGGRVSLSAAPPVNCCRPSIDVFFDSLAEEGCAQVVSLLLTGMGKDGARGLLRIRQRGGATLVQDEESSAIYGMPRAAVKLDAAQQVLSVEELPTVVASLFRSRLR